jgi:hypothetical protein
LTRCCLGFAARLADQLAVLLEQVPRLLAGLVGLLERAANPVAPLVDQLLDRAEGEALEDEEGDQEADDRPDHQSRRDLDQSVGCERHQDHLDEHVGENRPEQAVEDDGLGEREAEPLDALQLTAELGLAGDRLDHRAEDVADADAGTEGTEADAEREPDRLAGFRDVACCGSEKR